MIEDRSTSADDEDLYNSILGEIGLEYATGQAAVPSKKLVNPALVEEKNRRRTA